jgi:hypothetical protein
MFLVEMMDAAVGRNSGIRPLLLEFRKGNITNDNIKD